MKLLLDSHTFVWWRDEPNNLPPNVYDAISDRKNEVFLSLATAWELQIKIVLNKFKINGNISDAFNEEIQKNGFHLLPIELAHISYLDKLPFHHKDPFDRLIIAQALVENLTLVSGDAVFPLYTAQVIW